MLRWSRGFVGEQKNTVARVSELCQVPAAGSVGAFTGAAFEGIDRGMMAGDASPPPAAPPKFETMIVL